MAIDFPNSPSANDTFTVDDKAWIYSGGKWILQVTAQPLAIPVTITSVASGQFLKWNGSAWVNDAIDLGTDTTGSYVTSLVAGTGVTLTNNSGEGATPTVTVDTSTIQARVANVTDTEIGYLDGVTSAIQTQIDTKAPIASPTFTGTVSGITKTMVGLGSVDNTADTAKPVSTAQQTALDLKANLASPALTGTPTAPTAAASTNTTQVATTAFVRTEVANLVGTAGSTLDTLGEIATALGNDANLSTTLTSSIGLKAPLASPTFTGTVTIPSGASITAPTGLVKGDVGLGNVDNTSDANKPVSTASQTALDLKANLASPTFTGTVSGVTSTMVGLGNVNNTSDANKPVSTAQQTALDLKANLASPTFTGTVTIPSGASISGFAPLASPALTGTPTAPTAAANTNTTQVATTAFVATAVSGAAITALDDVGDVAITSATSGDLLKWNGSTWVNAAGYALLASPTFTGTVTTSDLTVSGNLTVSGTTTSINTTTLNVADNIVILNNDVTGSPTENAGIEVERGTSTNVAIRWNETDDKWQFTNDGSTYTDIGAGGGATVSSAAPASPLAGSIWFDSDTAQTFVYYDSQWIEIGSSGMAVLVSDSAPSSPIPGQLWFNSGNGGTYVYYSSAWTEVGAVPINALLNTINAKGDLLAGTADNTVGRLGVGTNGYFLKADSAQTTGLVWAAIPSVSILDDVGDVTITSAASGQVLQWNGSAWINATVSTDIMTDSKNAALLVMDIGA